MKKFIIPVIAAFALSFAACGDEKGESEEEGSEKDKKEETASAGDAAMEICECMEPLMSLNDRAQEVQLSGDTTEAQNIMAEIQGAQADAMNCVQGLQEKYQDDVSEDELKEALMEACPETAELMFGGH